MGDKGTPQAWCDAARIVSPVPGDCTASAWPAPNSCGPRRVSTTPATCITRVTPPQKALNRAAHEPLDRHLAEAGVTPSTRPSSDMDPVCARQTRTADAFAGIGTAFALFHSYRRGRGKGQLRQRADHRGREIHGGGLATPLGGPGQRRREPRSWQWSSLHPVIKGHALVVRGSIEIPPQGGHAGGNPATPVAGAPMEAPGPTPAGRGPSSSGP